jgi:hypothetical protein
LQSMRVAFYMVTQSFFHKCRSTIPTIVNKYRTRAQWWNT